MRRFIRRLVIACALLTVAAMLSMSGRPAPALASLYGSGAYAACSYNCPAPPTVVTIPSGLQVAINLTNGQTIPLSGYAVTVTPLNGQGATIQKAEFYVNSQLVFTGTPDETGTVHWQWTPAAAGDVILHIVIYGTDGSQTPKDFALHVRSSTPASGAGGAGGTVGTTSTPPASSQPTGIAAIPRDVAQALQRAGQSVHKVLKSVIQHVPPVVVYSFPYLLFALLGVLLIFFILQTRREVQAAAALADIVAGEKHIAEEKDTFMQLSEHYLRTPVTLIRGGAEVLGSPGDAPLPPGVPERLTALGTKLHDDVEAVIARLSANDLFAGIPQAQSVSPPRRLWLSAGFLVPVLGMFALFAFTQYLVQNVRQLNVTVVNQLVQGMIGAVLLAVFYLIFRRRLLRRQESAALEQVLRYQQAVDTARNDFIRDSAQALAAAAADLTAALKGLPDSQAIRTMREGCDRFRKVVSQFTVASRLAVGHSQEPPIDVNVATAFAQAQQAVASTLQAHHTKVVVQDAGAVVRCRQPQWLPFVLGSILDNAASYSSDGATVELSATPGEGADQLTITDHGEGMPPETLKSLFKPFIKTEGALQFTHEGLGFSLYLDKLIMTYLGGSITAKSEVGKGTSMTLLLPAQVNPITA